MDPNSVKDWAKKMLAEGKDFAFQEEECVAWKVLDYGEGKRFWIPFFVKEPSGGDKIVFETTSPVINDDQPSKDAILKKIMEGEEYTASRILSLDQLVKPEDFVPIFQVKK